MATFTGKANGNWSAEGQTTWNEAGTPAANDSVDLNGKVIVMDIATIPAGGGSLASLTSTVATGQLTINLSGTGLNGNATINATSITAGASTAAPFIKSTTNSANTLTINGNIVGGTGTAGVCIGIFSSSTNCTINGNITGGTGARAHAFAPDTVRIYGTFTFNGNITGGAGQGAAGVYIVHNDIVTVVIGAYNLINGSGGIAYIGPTPTWNLGINNYLQNGANILYFDVPGVANVLEADTVGGTAGTYHAPDAAEVISTAVFGPSSGTAGTFDEAARNTDPGEANVKTGTGYKIQNIAKNGSYSASGGTFCFID